MAKLRLYLFFGMMAAGTAITGCNRNTELEQLKKENPFKTGVKQPPMTTLLVSCEYMPLQMPGALDVTELAGWPGSKTDAAEGKTERASQTTGFSDANLEWWTLNGFHVVLAPMNTWPQFRESILKAGGVPLLKATAIFRNRTEYADFTTTWQDSQRSVFIAGPNGSLNGYTIGWGQCILRVICEPMGASLTSDSMGIKIVPVFISSGQNLQVERDASGTFRPVTKRPELIISELGLEGMIPKDHYLCIAAKASKDTPPSMGNIFMTQTLERQNYQLLCLLVPQMQTVTTTPPEPQLQKP